MEAKKIKTPKREEIGSNACNRLRKEGKIPAVLYGHKEESLPLTIDVEEMEEFIKEGVRLVDCQIGRKKERALIRDVQYDPLGDHILHVDFTRVSAHERITITVPVEYVGIPKGVTDGGMFEHQVDDVNLECYSDEIPEKIEVDVTSLELGSSIHISDLPIPEGTKIIADEKQVAALVKYTAVEEEAPEEEPEGEPEVLSETEKTKKDEEGEQKE